MNAERLEDGSVRIFGPVWEDVLPEDKREGWIKFYDRMHAEYGYPTYKQAADALRSLTPT